MIKKDIYKIIAIFICIVIIIVLILGIKNNIDNRQKVNTKEKEIIYCYLDEDSPTLDEKCEKRMVNIILPLDTQDKAEKLLKEIRFNAEIEKDEPSACINAYIKELQKKCDEDNPLYKKEECLAFAIIDEDQLNLFIENLFGKCWHYTERLSREHYQVVLGEINIENGQVNEDLMDEFIIEK